MTKTEKIGCVVIARSGSSRLPGKVLKKIKNETILIWLLKRIRKIKEFKDIVVATTTNKEDDQIEDLVLKNKFKVFRGSSDNVVKRLYQASKRFKFKHVVEVTADCPLIDPEIIVQCIKTYQKNSVDYLNNCFIRSYPDGMDIQIFNVNSLKKTLKLTKKSEELEHVGLFQMRNQKKFKVINLIAPKELYCPNLGLTLDEKQDFTLIKKVIEGLGKKNRYFSCKTIINYIKSKRLNKINSKVKRIGNQAFL